MRRKEVTLYSLIYSAGSFRERAGSLDLFKVRGSLFIMYTTMLHIDANQGIVLLRQVTCHRVRYSLELSILVSDSLTSSCLPIFVFGRVLQAKLLRLLVQFKLELVAFYSEFVRASFPILLFSNRVDGLIKRCFIAIAHHLLMNIFMKRWKMI